MSTKLEQYLDAHSKAELFKPKMWYDVNSNTTTGAEFTTSGDLKLFECTLDTETRSEWEVTISSDRVIHFLKWLHETIVEDYNAPSVYLQVSKQRMPKRSTRSKGRRR